MFTKHFKFYYYFRKENLILMLLHEFELKNVDSIKIL